MEIIRSTRIEENKRVFLRMKNDGYCPLIGYCTPQPVHSHYFLPIQSRVLLLVFMTEIHCTTFTLWMHVSTSFSSFIHASIPSRIALCISQSLRLISMKKGDFFYPFFIPFPLFTSLFFGLSKKDCFFKLFYDFI